jgi:hypothetical protein
MNTGLKLLTAAGAGAGLMYLFDPDRGKRRRALIGNKMTHAAKVAGEIKGKTQRDLRNHVRGACARAESLFRTREVSDAALAARVRSKLGRVVSHPSAIAVKTDDGRVILTGPILASEEHPLLNSITSIRGVKNIENCLELHEQAGDIPALQGGRPRQRERFGMLTGNWSPTTRLIATATGGALALYGAKRRGGFGSAIASFGLGFVIRALTNVETTAHIGVAGEHPVRDGKEAINIDAGEGFDYWSPPERASDIPSHVHELKCSTLTR